MKICIKPCVRLGAVISAFVYSVMLVHTSEAKQPCSTGHIWDSVTNSLEDQAIGLDHFSKKRKTEDSSSTCTSRTSEDTQLLLAAFSGNEQLVYSLLKSRAIINTRDADGNTALMLAVDQDHVSIVKLLSKFGANVNAQNSKGETALMIAVAHNNIQLVKFLVEKAHANTRLYTKEGFTALDIADAGHHSSLVDYLLTHTRP